MSEKKLYKLSKLGRGGGYLDKIKKNNIFPQETFPYIIHVNICTLYLWNIIIPAIGFSWKEGKLAKLAQQRLFWWPLAPPALLIIFCTKESLRKDLFLLRRRPRVGVERYPTKFVGHRHIIVSLLCFSFFISCFSYFLFLSFLFLISIVIATSSPPPTIVPKGRPM